MDFSSPYSVLLNNSVGRLLVVLAGTTRPLSGRELARLSDTPQTTARRALQRFAEHGLVHVQEAGNGAALLYSLNRQHVAADSVLVLVSLRQRLIERLAEEIMKWAVPPLHASLFGSAARGDGDTASDVDVLLVRPVNAAAEDLPWRHQIDHLPDLILAWTGNHAGIVEVSRGDIQRLVEEDASIVGEVRRDAITIAGDSFQDLVSAVRR